MTKLPDHRTGCWWDGITDMLVTLAGVPINLLNATIEFTVTALAGRSDMITKTVGAGIVITDAAGGRFRVDGFIAVLPPGQYQVKIAVTPQDDKRRVVLDADWTIVSRWGADG